MLNFLTLSVRLGLAGMFIAAGLIKLAQPEVFMVTVKAFGILPKAIVAPACYALIGLELLAGLLLCFKPRIGVPLSAGLLSVFIGIILYALHMGLDIDCGCYGPSEPEAAAFSSLRRSLWRDLAMLAGLFLVHLRHKAGANASGLNIFKSHQEVTDEVI